jgi:hypothetical protein
MNAPRRIGLDVTGLVLVMALVLGTFVAQMPAGIVAGTLALGVYALASGGFRGLRAEHWLLACVVLLLFLPAFVKPYHGLSPGFYLLSTVVCFFAARRFSDHDPRVLLAAWRVMFVTALLLVAAVLYIYWGEPEPFGLVIEGSSTNGIPAYLIIVQIGYSLAFFLQHERLPVWPTAATFAVAFFGNGRGSLVVAALLIVLTLLINLFARGQGSRVQRAAFLVFLALLGLLMLRFGGELIELVVAYTKLSVGLVDTNRLEIWDQYAAKLDASSLLLGADYAGTVIESEYRKNPHIAYIRTHAFFGLPVTTLALLSPFLALCIRRAWGHRLVFFGFIGLAALRAASEPLLFPTLLDFFYFSYFFMLFRHAPTSRRTLSAAT